MKEILINSVGAVNSSNFTTTLPFSSEIKLLEASIPISFDNVPASSFTIIGGTSGSNLITVSAGRYTQASFATYLQGLINTVILGQSYVVAQGSANNFVFSAAESFEIDGGTASGYIGFTTTTSATSHVGLSTSYNFFPSHMLIVIDKVLGIDNGTICNVNSVFHAVPMCSGGITNYRADESAPWVKLINLYGDISNSVLQISLVLSNGLSVNMNGDNWSMKIYAR